MPTGDPNTPVVLKRCTKCGILKSEAVFYAYSNPKRNGRTYTSQMCRSCINRRAVENRHKRRDRDPVEFSAKTREARAKRIAKLPSTLNCLQCGMPAKISKPSDIGRKKFCSRSCKSRWNGLRRDRRLIEAMQAGKTPETEARRKAAFAAAMTPEVEAKRIARLKAVMTPEFHAARLAASAAARTPESEAARLAASAAAMTPEVKAKRIAGLKRGPDHHAWVGGPSVTGQRPPDLTRTWRNAVFLRDDYTCQMCGQRGGRLQADHIQPYATNPDLRWEVSNGRTLCVPCHKSTPTYGAKFGAQIRRDKVKTE